MATDEVKGIAYKRPDPVDYPTTDRGEVKLVDVPKEDPLYAGILKDFKNAGLKPITVQRVYNYKLWERYDNEKEMFLKDRLDNDPNFDINERYLYHGTNGEKDIFKEEEIDDRLSNPGCFGNGIYFSNNPKKCKKYAEKGNKEKLILLERVILGEAKVYPKGHTDRKLKREPLKENPGRKNRRYDSVEGTPTQFTEYVIYDRRRALVDCIITYTTEKNEIEDDNELTTQQPIDISDIKATVQSSDTDTESDTTDDEREDERKSATTDEDATSSDEEYADAPEDNVDDSPDDEDETSGKESDGDDFQDTVGVPKRKMADVDPKMVKDFLQKTKEKEELIAQFYLVFENNNLESAIAKYNEPVNIDLTEEEEAEAVRLIKELEKDLCEPENVSNFNSLSQEDKEALMPKLVTQFCKICGLKPETSDMVARKHLNKTNWETDMAIFAYFEELYGLS